MIKRLIKENPVFKQKQTTDYNCGPTAMTYVMSLLGWEAHPEKICTYLQDILMKRLGTLPTWFISVSREYDIQTSDCLTKWEDEFANNLFSTVAEEEDPVILLVEGGHWIAVVGYDPLKDMYIINDPADETNIVELIDEKELIAWAYSELPLYETHGYYFLSFFN